MLKDMNFGITNPYNRYGRISNPTKHPSFLPFLILPFFHFLLSACTGGTVLHSYKPLPAEGWERCNTVCFDIPKAEADIDGSLFIGLRTAAHIGIEEVVLAVEQYSETSGLLRRDTVRYPLNDDEGNALTGGVNYHQYENRQLPILLQKDKSAAVRIHHLMTHEVISGITEVGIRIDKH